MHQLRMSQFSPFCGWTSSLPDVFFFSPDVFFFSPLLCPTYLPPPIPPPTSPVLPTTYLPPPTLNLPPLPTYHLRTPPPLHSIARARLVQRKLLLWSCGVGAGARAPTRPMPPRLGKMLIFYFIFVCFVWRGKQAPSSGASPELLGSGACLLQLNPATQQAPELVRLRTELLSSRACLLQLNPTTQQAPELVRLRSVRACCCNAANSRACPALELVALQ
jgi:hypothetical protein